MVKSIIDSDEMQWDVWAVDVVSEDELSHGEAEMDVCMIEYVEDKWHTEGNDPWRKQTGSSSSTRSTAKPENGRSIFDVGKVDFGKTMALKVDESIFDIGKAQESDRKTAVEKIATNLMTPMIEQATSPAEKFTIHSEESGSSASSALSPDFLRKVASWSTKEAPEQNTPCNVPVPSTSSTGSSAPSAGSSLDPEFLRKVHLSIPATWEEHEEIEKEPDEWTEHETAFWEVEMADNDDELQEDMGAQEVDVRNAVANYERKVRQLISGKKRSDIVEYEHMLEKCLEQEEAPHCNIQHAQAESKKAAENPQGRQDPTDDAGSQGAPSREVRKKEKKIERAKTQLEKEMREAFAAGGHLEIWTKAVIESPPGLSSNPEENMLEELMDEMNGDEIEECDGEPMELEAEGLLELLCATEDISKKKEVDVQDGHWRRLKVAMDSGANVDVMPEDACNHVGVEACTGPRRGTKLAAANGTLIETSGEKHITGITDEGLPVDWRFIAGKVKKALKSTASTCDEDKWVIHTKTGGWIVDVATKKKIGMKREGNSYVVDVWMKAPRSPVFTRPSTR